MATTVSVYCIMQGKGTRCVYIFMSFYWFVGTVFVHVCSIYKELIVSYVCKNAKRTFNTMHENICLETVYLL